MLTKEQKREASDQLRARLDEVRTLFVMQNHGLNVNEINELRSQIRKTEASYKVVKNSVVRMAVEGTEMDGLRPHLIGPNAFAFTSGDGVALAKVLKEFAKGHPALKFRQAFLEGQILEAEDAEKIADLPSKDELISKMLFLLQSPIRRLAIALNAPVQQLATALGHIAENNESQES